MNKLQQYLSQNIKKYRKQKKLSQEKLADLAGISEADTSLSNGF